MNENTLRADFLLDNKLGMSYPNGRVVSNTYDALNRISVVSDELGPVAVYNYIGPRRVEQRLYINSQELTLEYDGIVNAPGDFGVKRPVRATHRTAGGGLVTDDRAYAWDRMYNKTRRKDVRTGGPEYTHDYAYDSIYRLGNSSAACNA